MVEPPRTHTNLPCGPASPFMVRVSSRRFDHTEPPRTTVMVTVTFCPRSHLIQTLHLSFKLLVWSNRLELSRTCPVGLLPPNTVVRVGSVWSNHSELTLTCPVGLLSPSSVVRGGSSKFGAVRPHRTSPKHCDAQRRRPTGQVRVSSGRFDNTEPHRITVMQGEAGLQTIHLL